MTSNIDPLHYLGIHPNYLIGDGWSEESKDLFRDLCEYKGTPCRFQSNLMPDLYRTNIVDLCTEVATKTMSEWINVKEYMINLGKEYCIDGQNT